MTAAAGGITDITFQNTTNVQLADQVCTFGHVFKQGDLPAAGAAVSLVGPTTLPTQIDVKGTHPDGSVRHAVLSVVVPSLPANASARYNLTPVAATAPKPVAPADFAALDATVTVVDAGVPYAASLAALLAGGYKTWLAGDIATEWLVAGPLITSAGAAHPDVTVRFNVRAYKRKAKARIDVILENTRAPHASSVPIRHAVYDLTIAVGGIQVLAETAVVHLPFTRTRKTFWWGGAAPSIHVRHNTTYAIGTKALPNYDPSLIGATNKDIEDGYAAALAGARGTFKNGLACAYMPTTGGRPDIGLLPGWDALYILGMNPAMREVCFAQTDLMGSWGIHRRDPATDQAVSPIDHPRYSYPAIEKFQLTNITAANPAVVTTAAPHRLIPGMRVLMLDVAGTMGVNYSVFDVGACTPTTFQIIADLTGQTYGGGGTAWPENPNSYDDAHTPAVGFAAYMFSGDHYHLEELQFYASTSSDGQTTYGNQSRAQAWDLRDRAHAAYISPDDDRLKGHFRSVLGTALSDYNAKFVDDPAANKLGALTGGSSWSDPDSYGNVTRTWQDDFFTQSLGHIVELGFTEALPIFQFKAKYVVSRIAYCRMLACNYNFKLRNDAASPPYENIAQVFAATYPPEILAAPFDSAAMAALVAPYNEGQPVIADSMIGNPSFHEGYVANMQPALALAASLGASGAVAAWNSYEGRAVKQNGYATNPQFAIVPRSAPALPVPPVLPTPPAPVKKVGKITSPSSTKLAKAKNLTIDVFDPATLAVVKSFTGVGATTKGVVSLADPALVRGNQYAATVKDEKGNILLIFFPLIAVN